MFCVHIGRIVGGITHYYHAHILECTHIHASVIPFQYTFLENYQWPCLVE